MRAYLSLAWLYIRSFYQVPGKKYKEGGKAASVISWKPRGKGLPEGTREILRFIGALALTILVLMSLGTMFVVMNLGVYDSLAPQGLQGLMILNAVVNVTLVTLFLGFLMALSTYFVHEGEQMLLALPIPPRAFLGAKMTAVYLTEAGFSLFMMGVTMVVFGIKEGPGLPFYVHGALAALVLPLPALALSYLVIVPLMALGRFLRNKQTILVVGGIVGMAFAITFNVYYQTLLSRVGDPAWVAANLTGPESFLIRLGQAWPPSLLAWRAMTSSDILGGIFHIVGLLALALGMVGAVVWLWGPAYAATLTSFNESNIKRLKAGGAQGFLGRRLRAAPVFQSLLLREIRLMNREPMYLLNGPLIILLLPVIFGIMAVAQGERIFGSPEVVALAGMLGPSGGMVLAAVAGAFLGTATSISCTALSRDAKALGFLKSLPLDPGLIMGAKLAHAMVFAVVGALMGGLSAGLVLGLPWYAMAASVASALSLSAVVHVAGLALDTLNPRLDWDNPIAAMKQNPNAVIVILGSMGALGATTVGGLAWNPGLPAFLGAFVAAPLTLAGLGFVLYRRWAVRRFEALEA